MSPEQVAPGSVRDGSGDPRGCLSLHENHPQACEEADKVPAGHPLWSWLGLDWTPAAAAALQLGDLTRTLTRHRPQWSLSMK